MEWKAKIEDFFIFLGFEKNKTLNQKYNIWLVNRIRSIVENRPRVLLIGIKRGTKILTKLNSVYKKAQTQCGI